MAARFPSRIAPLPLPLTVAIAIAAGFWPAPAPARDPAAPPGYFVDAAQLFGHRPDTLEALVGEFTYSIRRSWPDARGERLLEVAEATYPPRATMEDAALENSWEIGADSTATSLWWAKGVGPARVPYAVTRGALDYYLDLSRQYRDRKPRGPASRPIFESDFRYRGSIVWRAQHSLEDTLLQNVYVATLDLEWIYDDGTFDVRIRAHRSVVLTPEGGVRHVSGDGMADEVVSMSLHRGIGREENRSQR